MTKREKKSKGAGCLVHLIRGEKGSYESVLVLAQEGSEPEYYRLIDRGFREAGEYKLIPTREEQERLPQSGVFCNAFGPSPIGRPQ